MILIAHRGNLVGPNPDKENHPDYILNALDKGFDVEIDVWFLDGKFILGHDNPQYEVDQEFLLNEKFWHHTKNIKAFYAVNKMRPNFMINCFYHEVDDATLTSGGWLWTYPGKELTEDSIAVMPETVPNWDFSKAAGVCTDFPERYKQDANKDI